MMILYNSRDIACKQPFGAVKAGETVTFTLKLHKTVQAEELMLQLFLMDRWEQPMNVMMEHCGADLVYNSFTCSYTAPQPGIYVYHFVYKLGHERREICRGRDGAAVLGTGELWQLTVYDGAMQTPACLGEGVMYQIFPDRFCNSGKPKAGVPQDRALRTDWGALPEWQPDEAGEVTNSDYFGGDLAGIGEKLPYLATLGVTCIYLNPVFEAHSNHRYNTADYKKIDPLLGTNDDFQALCRQAKALGIAVVLDGVFSHTGSDSAYFNMEGRYGKGGAFNDPYSPYRPWYIFYHYPDYYESWWGFKTLPNVKETDPAYLEFICGNNGVLRHWLRLGAEGFRLDVADELPDEFLDRLREAVKAENPSAAVIGEVWEDASNKVSYGTRRRYLLGEQLDSVMNYPFKDAILNYVRHGGGMGLYNAVMVILENYPPPVIAGLMNSLSTHDTPRAITVLAGDYLGENGRDWQEAHHKLSDEQYALGKELFVLASIIQFGLPGMPCVYYGDEAGLCGYKDPFNRVCYPWGGEDTELLRQLRALGNIRKKYPVFSTMEFTPLMFGNELCAFLRSDARHTFLFAVNRGGDARPLPVIHQGKPLALLGGENIKGGLLKGRGGIVLLWEK